MLKTIHWTSYKFGQTERRRKREWSKTLGKERLRWDRDEIETTRSLVRWDRDDEIGGTDELWVENENEIGNNSPDELWVENENDANWELGAINSTARSRLCVWGWGSILPLRLGLGLDLAAASVSAFVSPPFSLSFSLYASMSFGSDLKVK